jgi:hypothetical protein
MANKPSTLDALLRGGGQGVSLGFSDELAGGGAALMSLLGLRPDKSGVAGNWEEAKKEYRSMRDAERQKNIDARLEHKRHYTAGDLIGSLLVPLPGGPASTATRAMKTAATAAKGGLMAGGRAVGSSDKPLEEMSAAEVILPAIAGAGAGAAARGGAEFLGKHAYKVPELLSRAIPNTSTSAILGGFGSAAFSKDPVAQLAGAVAAPIVSKGAKLTLDALTNKLRPIDPQLSLQLAQNAASKVNPKLLELGKKLMGNTVDDVVMERVPGTLVGMGGDIVARQNEVHKEIGKLEAKRAVEDTKKLADLPDIVEDELPDIQDELPDIKE